MLPARVDGRDLQRWSIVGRCWIEFVARPSQATAIIDAIRASADPGEVDLSALRYGVAGRADTDADPPYFVFVAARPRDDGMTAVALVLLTIGAGYRVPPDTSLELANYDERRIAGHQVFVGSEDMVTQSDHQQGRPYLYETDEFLFVLVTDSEAWASEAIAQLPAE